jgi:hypothetical protein
MGVPCLAVNLQTGRTRDFVVEFPERAQIGPDQMGRALFQVPCEEGICGLREQISRDGEFGDRRK